MQFKLLRTTVFASFAVGMTALACSAPENNDGGTKGIVVGDGDGDGDFNPGGDGDGDGTGVGDGDGDNEETCVMLPDGSEECFCLTIAVIGTADSAADESNATAFRDWLNTKSNAFVEIYDPKDAVNPQAKPTLNAEFLNKYDVIIMQLQGDSKIGPFWTYSADEIAAVKAWVEAGGGLISLTGYNGDQKVAETAASNSLLSGVTGMTYGAQDIATSGGTDNYCRGNSVPINSWEDSPISYEVSAVGAYSGYPVSGGTPVAYDSGMNVIGATAQVGEGYALVWGDEWVIFTNQWYTDPTDSKAQPGDPCEGKLPEDVFQLPQFWYNSLQYVSQANQCVLKIDEPSIILR